MSAVNPALLYQCFWCDRTTKHAQSVRLDRATGRLICHECYPDIMTARRRVRKERAK